MDLPFEFSWPGAIGTTLVLYILYGIGLAIYRLYFHPLSKFPGPKLNALSYWPEIYHDVWREGMYIWEVDKFHDIYGPIVRFNPDEIHIRDSQFFDTLYTKAGRVEKYEKISNRFQNSLSAFGTPNPELHAMRRGPLNPFFSRGKIMEMEPVIRGKIETLVDRLREMRDNGVVFRLDQGYAALTGDIIMQYFFSFTYNHLRKPGFNNTFKEPFDSVGRSGALGVYFPTVSWLMSIMPRSWLTKLQPDFRRVFTLQDDLQKEIVALKTRVDRRAGAKEREEDKMNNIIYELLTNADLPDSEKAVPRLQDEAQAIIGAGLLTTAWSLTVGSFFISNQPETYKKLAAELEAAIPDPDAPLRWKDLERLPYLTGCVRESIRLSNAVSGRSPRILNRPLTYNDWVIPARTPVSMTIPDVVFDETVFPDHLSFRPERWLDSPKTPDGSSLERFLVTFGRGTRSCQGINLAHAELYHVLATVFRKFRFELVDTTVEDVAMSHDFFVPFPKLDTKGVQVRCF